MPLKTSIGRGPVGATRSVLRGPARESKFAETRGRMQKLFDWMSTGEFASVGVIEELQRRDKFDFPTRSLFKAAQKGIQQRRTYTDLTGNPATGITLSFVADPLLLPMMLFPPAAAARTLAKIPAVAKGVKAAKRATETVPGLKQLRNTFENVFVVDAKLKRFNPPEQTQLKKNYYNDVMGKSARVERGTRIEVARALPDPRSAQRVLLMADSEPKWLIEGPPSPAWIAARKEWDDVFATLTPQEQAFYPRTVQILEEIEDTRLARQFIDQERANNLVIESGRQYVPRLIKTKKDWQRGLDTVEKAMKRGDPQAAIYTPALVAKARQIVDESVDVAETLRDVMPQIAGRARPAFRVPAFELERSTRGLTASEVDEVLFGLKKGPLSERINRLHVTLETDLGLVLGQAQAANVRAEAGQTMINGFITHMERNGLILPLELENAGQAAKLAFIRANAKGLTETQEQLARRISQDGFVRMDLIDPVIENGNVVRWVTRTGPQARTGAIAGKLIPKSLANEILQVVEAYENPEIISDVLGMLGKSTRWWKAWTLGPFLIYWDRNKISNYFNMRLGGMTLREYAVHQPVAARLSVKYTREVPFSNHRFKFDKWSGTDEQMVDMLQDLRMIGSGWSVGEVGMLSEGTMERGIRRAYSLFDPRPSKNPLTIQTFKWGRALTEDADKITGFLHRLAKGDSPNEAAEWVHKFLFDYQAGLTKFEARAFRDGIFPFYTFTRFNLPLQLEMLASNPVAYARLGKTTRAIEDIWGGPEPNEQYLSEWMREGWRVRIGWDQKTGNYNYFFLDNFLPAAALANASSLKELFNEMLSLVNPILKVPYELLSNYSLWREEPIIKPGRRVKKIRVGVPGISAEVPVDARIDHLLRNFRPINEMDRIIMAFDRQGFMGAAQRFALGSVYPVNIADQKKWWNKFIGVRTSFLKREQSRIQNLMRKGEAGPDDRQNLVEIEEQLLAAEALIRELR